MAEVTGKASYYGPGFYGNTTSQGDPNFTSQGYTAAIRKDLRKQFGAGTYGKSGLARVTNLNNGRSIIVKVNDVGPLPTGRVVDLSEKSFRALSSGGTLTEGLLNNVKVEYIGEYKSGSKLGPVSPVTEIQVTPFVPTEQPTNTESNPIPVPDKEIFIESNYVGVDDLTLDQNIESNRKQIDELNQKSSRSWTQEEQDKFKELRAKQDSLFKEKAIRENKECNSKQTSKGHNLPNTPECEKFAKSVANGRAIEKYNTERDLPDPCGTSELSKINTALHKFFTTLKGIKKYADIYIKGALNKISSITNLIRNTARIIGAVLKTLVNRLRDWLIDKIRRGIEKLIDMILPTIAKVIKNTIVQAIVDEIFCRFKDIVKGLANLVTDFLFELIGKVVNAPFCLAQQFTNALVNNLAAIIDESLGPVLDQINDILSGVTSVVGSVFQALDYILGFEAFLCAKPNCPEIKKFKASPWAGPSQSQIDAFNNFLPVPTESDIVGGVEDYINNIEIFGTRIGDAPTASSSITNCDPSAFECGPPKIEIFGGGGVGAVGQAVVDNIGRTIGVDLIFGGSNYTRPPFVAFVDSCEDTFTTGYAVINDDGQVTDIVMTSTPVAPPNDGRTEFDLPSDSTGRAGNGGRTEFDPPSGSTGRAGNGGVGSDGTDYVVCLEGFRVADTGVGYTTNDSIRITPDIPNLEAVVKMTEFGQILDIQFTGNVCGLSGYPEIEINSQTGHGAVIEPIISFTRIEEFDRPQGDSDFEVDSDSVISAEIVSNDREGLITTLRGRKILTDKQEFTRRDIIRVIDCVS